MDNAEMMTGSATILMPFPVQGVCRALSASAGSAA